jgi:predicted nuclease of predicted toxin-antitoxin system
MTPPRLYLDEDVDPLLARVLTDRGFDVLTTQDAGRIASSDADQLTFAAREGRAVVTHNAAHFATLARMYARSGMEHHGIVISDQVPFKELLARTLRLLDRHPTESLRNHLIWLQDYR